MSEAAATAGTGSERPHALRWWALALAAIAVSSSYYEDDVIGPIADLLHRQRGFDQAQLGLLNGVISVPNALIALSGGILIDRFGASRVAWWSAVIGVAGAVLTAIGEPYGLMVAGRFVFGVSEGAIFIALIAGLARWFPASGLALATALYLSLARVGSYAVDTSTAWAHALYERGWQAPLWLGALVSLAGLLAAGGFRALDLRRGRSVRGASVVAGRQTLRGLLSFDRSYWYILGVHVLYAAVFFPFRTTFAIEYFQHVKGLTLREAGVTNSWVFFAAIFATPLFGLAADRLGRRASMLVLGTALLPATFLVLGLSHADLWVSTVMMGVSFSLVPAVIWPATTLILEPERLGRGLGLITLVQAAAMAGANLAAGWLADRSGAGASNPAGYTPMLVFFFLTGVAALVSALLLWRRESGSGGHGLERPPRAVPERALRV
ncbi:MAG: MFS transporter [Gammaproteobacteria bacterium]|nr:MFS transporter [Gammaproteobacteria bacterium]